MGTSDTLVFVPAWNESHLFAFDRSRFVHEVLPRASELRRLVASLRNVFKGTPNVTASIGVVACTATEASTDDLLRRADQAMYDAKKSGKDRVVQVAL